MAPYHILIVIISSVIPENLVLLTKSEQSGPKSAHIRPTNKNDNKLHLDLASICYIFSWMLLELAAHGTLTLMYLSSSF